MNSQGTVLSVSHPAHHSQRMRPADRRIAKPDTLHLTLHDGSDCGARGFVASIGHSASNLLRAPSASLYFAAPDASPTHPAVPFDSPLAYGLSTGLCSASMGAVTVAELWRRGQFGWPRSFPIAQFPNPPLLLAFAGWGVAAASGGTVHEIGRVVSTVGLTVWAGEEVIGGVNWFRRLLGAGALIWIGVGLAGEL